jgi:hypothetical protein
MHDDSCTVRRAQATTRTEVAGHSPRLLPVRIAHQKRRVIKGSSQTMTRVLHRSDTASQVFFQAMPPVQRLPLCRDPGRPAEGNRARGQDSQQLAIPIEARWIPFRCGHALQELGLLMRQ